MADPEQDDNEYIAAAANSSPDTDDVNNAFAIDPDCQTVADAWDIAKKNGLLSENFSDLETSVEALKAAINKAYLYDGPTELIHDTKILNFRNDFIGSLGAKIQGQIGTWSPITLSSADFENIDLNAESIAPIQTALNTFMDALKVANGNYVQDFITLHFRCFKNCNETDCLTMD
jgi:hypothetical protein